MIDLYNKLFIELADVNVSKNYFKSVKKQLELVREIVLRFSILRTPYKL